MRLRDETRCGHDVSYKQQCIECEIVWEKECIASAERDLAKHTERLAMFKRIQRKERIVEAQ